MQLREHIPVSKRGHSGWTVLRVSRRKACTGAVEPLSAHVLQNSPRTCWTWRSNSPPSASNVNTSVIIYAPVFPSPESPLLHATVTPRAGSTPAAIHWQSVAPSEFPNHLRPIELVSKANAATWIESVRRGPEQLVLGECPVVQCVYWW